MKKLYLVLLVLILAMVVVAPVAAAPALQGEDPEGEEEVDLEVDGPLVNVEGSLSSAWQLAGLAAAAIGIMVANRWVFEKLISSPIVDSVDSKLLKKLQPLLVTMMAILVAQVFDLDLSVALSDVIGFVNAPADPATGQLLTGVATGMGAIAYHERLAG